MTYINAILHFKKIDNYFGLKFMRFHFISSENPEAKNTLNKKPFMNNGQNLDHSNIPKKHSNIITEQVSIS